jgi:5-amino-6-(5-phospho-D-ribitylamino)uracil phosphatase
MAASVPLARCIPRPARRVVVRHVCRSSHGVTSQYTAATVSSRPAAEAETAVATARAGNAENARLVSSYYARPDLATARAFFWEGVVRLHRHQKYKWLVLDVDGTLLDSQHILRPKVAAAVVAAASAGLRVTLATGKLLRSILPLLEQMHITGPQIVLNGAATCQSETGEPLRFCPLIPSARRTIIELVRSYDPDVLISCFGLDTISMDTLHPGSGIFAEYGENPPVLVPDLLASDLDATAKVLLYGGADQLATLRQHMRDHLPPGVIMTSTTADFLEFFDAQAGKGPALEALKRKLGISTEAVIAIGDGENDVPLLRGAGLAIAMANGTSAARAAAALIAPSNDQEGVAVVLEELLG